MCIKNNEICPGIFRSFGKRHELHLSINVTSIMILLKNWKRLVSLYGRGRLSVKPIIKSKLEVKIMLPNPWGI